MRLLPFTALIALASAMIAQGITIPKGSTVPNAPLQRKLLTAQEITSLYAQNGLTVPTGVSSKFISSAPIHNAPVTTVAAPPRKLATKGIDINDCSINYSPCDLYIQDTLTAQGIDVDSENYDQAITDLTTQWTKGLVDTRTMNQYITMSNSILGIKTPQIGAPVAASAPQRKLLSEEDTETVSGAGRTLLQKPVPTDNTKTVDDGHIKSSMLDFGRTLLQKPVPTENTKTVDDGHIKSSMLGFGSMLRANRL